MKKSANEKLILSVQHEAINTSTEDTEINLQAINARREDAQKDVQLQLL